MKIRTYSDTFDCRRFNCFLYNIYTLQNGIIKIIRETHADAHICTYVKILRLYSSIISKINMRESYSHWMRSTELK